jgi:DNA-binding winged helix-turn-helix (wHTH) protein
LLLCDNDFSNSIKELKQELSFNISFLPDKIESLSFEKFQLLLIQDSFMNGNEKKLISQIKNTSKLKIFFQYNKFKKPIGKNENIKLPLSISEFNNKILEIISKKEFDSNSKINIGNYILDKNARKLINKNLSVILTEKEIQLLELLNKKSNNISKKEILNSVWKYSSDADTHTVETHIYRLRKKIKEIFFDENLILNNKEGYLIEKDK